MNTDGIYEIINFSDLYTFRAPNDLIAEATTILLGNGAYGLHRCSDDATVGTLLIFASQEQAEAYLLKQFGMTLDGYLKANALDIAAALESVLCMSANERQAYELAISMIEPSQRDTYRDKVHDINRTSLNDIGSRAWALAKRLRDASNDDEREIQHGR